MVAVPPSVITLTIPVVAPTGTIAVMDVSETTLKILALVLLNLTAVAPVKCVPVMVTLIPIDPLVGVKLLMVGAGTNTNVLTERLNVPPLPE